MIFLILIGATVFGYYMTLSRIPQSVVALVTEMDLIGESSFPVATNCREPATS